MKVLITGASSGLGRDMAKVLAHDCDTMILVGRDVERLEQVKAAITARYPIDVQVVATDLSVAENCVKLCETYPDVDLLINNAGFGDFGAFNETALDKDLAMINTNVVAVHILTKLYLAQMKPRDHGHILNVASIAGFMPGPLMTTYYATKSYVVRLSEGIREELRRAKSKVKISILCPGPVATNFDKTANVQFNFNGVDCMAVAKYAIKHLNRFYIVPGAKIKMARMAAGLLPSRDVAKVVYQIQAKRKK